jgi:hypothetical protein
MDVISIPLLIITIHPIGGRGNQTRDDQTTIKNDSTADETGIRMPAVISLDQVSMIMVIRRGRIGLVGNGHREQPKIVNPNAFLKALRKQRNGSKRYNDKFFLK